MIYVYAIVDRPELPVPQTDGLEDAPVHLVVHRDIGAMVSSTSTAKAPTTEANLWRHESVMDALMAERTLLPVRFGTTLADEESVRHVLAAHYAGFAADLLRVRGHVELALRVYWDDGCADAGVRDLDESDTASAVDIGPGHKYMIARLKEYRNQQKQRERAEEYVRIIHSTLSDVATQSAHRLLPRPRVLMTSAYLVKNGDLEDFRRQLENLRVSCPALRFLCTGPWPPFTFVSEEECRNGNNNSWSDAFAVGLGRLG